jgi:rubrerythrin
VADENRKKCQTKHLDSLRKVDAKVITEEQTHWIKCRTKKYKKKRKKRKKKKKKKKKKQGLSDSELIGTRFGRCSRRLSEGR